jgi:hypothetical protein
MTNSENTNPVTGQKIYATLRRGRYYDYNGKVWDRESGKDTQEVTEEEALWLKENGVDRKTVDEMEELIQKFDFSDTSPDDADDDGGNQSDKSVAVRVRRRAA